MRRRMKHFLFELTVMLVAVFAFFFVVAMIGFVATEVMDWIQFHPVH